WGPAGENRRFSPALKGDAPDHGALVSLSNLMIRQVNDSLTIANELRPVVLRLARHLRREIHSLGVTGGQVSLLVAIKQSPGITARELADRERISAPGMSGHLVRLEAADLIRRERASDRRRIGLFVTEEGE